MELLEFKNKIFELLNVTKTSEIGNALLDVVLKPNFYILMSIKNFVTVQKTGCRRYGNIMKLTERKRNKTTHQRAFVN